MTRIYVLCIAALFAVAGTLVSQSPISAHSQNKFKKSQNPIPNRYIVVLRNDFPAISGDDIATVIARISTEYAGTVDKLYGASLKGFSIETTADEAERLSADLRVKYVEEDSWVAPADVEYNPSWALDRIDQRVRPYDLAYHYSATGAGVNAYIIDTGVLTTHVEIAGRAYDAVNTSGDPSPMLNCNGHGTGVAGALGSRTFGVAKRVSLFSVRVFPCTGSTSVSNVIAGVDWVTQHAIHPAVANMSVEAGLSTAMNDAVNASIASGIPYVVAAGNEADDACSHSPSSIPNAIVVGGTDSSDQRLSYSNFGPCLDLFAPGGGVPTIWNTTNTMTGALSGTSVASPIVAGVVALYLQSHPLASPLEVQVYLRGHGTTGVIADAGVGSLNLLLYSPATGSGDPCQGNAYLTRPSCASTASD